MARGRPRQGEAVQARSRHGGGRVVLHVGGEYYGVASIRNSSRPTTRPTASFSCHRRWKLPRFRAFPAATRATQLVMSQPSVATSAWCSCSSSASSGSSSSSSSSGSSAPQRAAQRSVPSSSGSPTARAPRAAAAGAGALVARHRHDALRPSNTTARSPLVAALGHNADNRGPTPTSLAFAPNATPSARPPRLAASPAVRRRRRRRRRSNRRVALRRLSHPAWLVVAGDMHNGADDGLHSPSAVSAGRRNHPEPESDYQSDDDHEKDGAERGAKRRRFVSVSYVPPLC
ncbi:Putative transcriptional regulatory protein [Tolypocladium paradoxum]|uniref:Transcriptional regulatory protein n=1 Tax=Tolypocladium paradoxum TaxID=94208 RepID=A0A2S4L4Z0_9HYPO|nr:Putative transcriptional regulatory protein [Tolypocladium paradoxum]